MPLTPPTPYFIVNGASASGNALYVDEALESYLLFDSAKLLQHLQLDNILIKLQQ